MPGRGQPWRGVGKGNQDRIGSGEIEDDSLTSDDIKDLTITDADIANATISEGKLDSAVQAKLNAGGGSTFADGVPLTRVMQYDDFLYADFGVSSAFRNIYETNLVNGGLGNNAFPNGILFFSSGGGSSNGDGASLLGGGGNNNLCMTTTLNTEAKFSGGFGPSGDNPTDNITVIIGIVQGNSVPGGTTLTALEADIEGGAWFRYDPLTNANWQAVSRHITTGGVLTTNVIDTGVTVASETYQDFEITLDGTTAKWFIDGSEVASTTSAYPGNFETPVISPAPNFYLNFVCNSVTRTTAQRFFLLDYFHILTDRIGFINEI